LANAINRQAEAEGADTQVRPYKKMVATASRLGRRRLKRAAAYLRRALAPVLDALDEVRNGDGFGDRQELHLAAVA
jgi:hypothetical protein